jgi:rod shape-determining protein MreD
VRRALLAAVAILAAVLLQVTLLNNVPFPGGAGPDLVLVVVVALSLTSSARDGAIIGFAAGLALDIAPPASNLLGQSALVFCLVGYGCGRLRVVMERSAWLPVAGVAVGAAAGEALYALVGLTFGDPDVTLQAVRQVLPAAVFYDLLISPFVLYAVARLGGYARWGSDAAPTGLLTGRELAAAGGGVLAGVGAASGAIRDTGVGRSPRLRAAGHRTDGWIGTRREQSGQPAGAWLDQRRPPRLRLRGGVAGSATASQAAKPARPAAAVHLRLGSSRRRDGAIVAQRHLAGAGPGAAFDGRASNWASRPARLRGGALSGGPSALGQGQPRKQRQPRLKLGSKRGRDGLGGGWFSALRRPGRRRQMGKGSFASGSAVRAGSAGAGRSAAAPRFRSSTRARKPAAALRSSAPRFRRPKARWQRAGRRLGLGGSRGAGPGMATRSWRRRFSRRGKGGWR